MQGLKNERRPEIKDTIPVRSVDERTPVEAMAAIIVRFP
jgi:hypothetical protein